MRPTVIWSDLETEYLDHAARLRKGGLSSGLGGRWTQKELFLLGSREPEALAIQREYPQKSEQACSEISYMTLLSSSCMPGTEHVLVLQKYACHLEVRSDELFYEKALCVTGE